LLVESRTVCGRLDVPSLRTGKRSVPPSRTSAFPTVIAGVPSSSVIVPVPLPSPTTAGPARTLSVTVSVSLSSFTASSAVWTVNVPDVWPAAIVTSAVLAA
jgi:hypothetical protein